MRWPAATPLVFSGGQRFVQQHGDEVWAILCDTVRTGVWITVREAADLLPCLSQYAPRTRIQYLNQVLKAILEDVIERPEEYDQIPFQTRGQRLTWIKL